jgi:low affinity Fe/Cu permease
MPTDETVPRDSSDSHVDDALNDQNDSARPSKVIARKTAQLPTLSKIIYHVDHYTSMSVVVMAFTVALIAMLILGAILGFPNSWVVAFEVAVSSVTLLMVFTIQHTQGREQLATQRKLDELLKATPGAAESLMMLEEAPREFMIEVEENQREARADLVDDEQPSLTSDSKDEPS